MTFLAGIAGIGFETVVDKAEKPTLVVLFAAMIGLPAFLRKDEQEKPPTPQTPAPPSTEDKWL